MNPLRTQIDTELSQPLPEAVREFASALAGRDAGIAAVLYYGSTLRSGDLAGLLDFYVLVDAVEHWPQSRWAAWGNRLLPPNVFHETHASSAGPLRAKLAVLSSEQFARGLRPQALDTTLWARFAQPCALAWARDEPARQRTAAAIQQAVITAADWARRLGPVAGVANDYWRALFARTYAAELRVERGTRSGSLLDHDPQRYARLLPLAWEAAGQRYERDQASEQLRPRCSTAERAAARRAWRLRQWLGKPLNILRLLKAASTFADGADYVVWKVRRHAGIELPLSDWQRRHPLLAAPGVFWQLWRAGAFQRSADTQKPER